MDNTVSMKLPVILVNFKNYKESTNSNSLKLAEICDSVSKEFGVNISVSPSYSDIKEIKDKTTVPIFSQHIDPIENAGAYTGAVVAENLKEIGIAGSLLNHSERKMDLKNIEKCIGILRKLNLVSVCCASDLEEVGKIAKLGPDFISIEPPELIGTGVSVSTTRPEVVTKTIEIVKGINPKINVLCGAGVANGQDVRKAIELGTCGVLVSSRVVKAEDQRKILLELAKSL